MERYYDINLKLGFNNIQDYTNYLDKNDAIGLREYKLINYDLVKNEELINKVSHGFINCSHIKLIRLLKKNFELGDVLKLKTDEL